MTYEQNTADSDRGREEQRLRLLLLQTAEGNKESFEAFYSSFVNPVYSFLKKRFRDEQLIQELIQDVFVAVWQGAGRFQGQSSAASWLFAIVRNKMLDVLRRRYKTADERMPLALDEIAEHGAAQPDFSGSLLTGLTVREAVKRLEPEARQLVELVFVLGLSYSEVARVLSIPEGTVKSRVYHLKNALRKIMPGEGGDQ
ncbi:hypothetical protein DNH61_05845 [Paenibacillus sambharensis]|uniref:RNA polymerase sigma factor n=1 Tax=Paenibacillus sambharensis TaxID=1803190 RepID=A0A2W1LDI4_9BACL|nr:RNA polymerase sigma factor [Paenibacillus sambharensis]PZD96719.1 hypothetical protein DNH61_05845 [Paenibacillus sambharensis]